MYAIELMDHTGKWWHHTFMADLGWAKGECLFQLNQDKCRQARVVRAGVVLFSI